MYATKEKLYPAYVSKHNSNREKQVVLFMISNGEGRERSKTLANVQVRRTMALSCIKKTISIIKRNNVKTSPWFLLSKLPSFFCNRKLELHKKVCENKDFCNVIMPSEDTKILEFNQYQKPVKAPFIIYADLECIIEKIDGYKSNPENSSTTEVSEHIPSGFSMSTISLFKSIENKHVVYRGKDCMKKFCESLREHATKIINSKKKKMTSLTKEQQESYENAEICYICKEKFENKYVKDKNCRKVRDHCHYAGEYRGAAHSICNLKYSVPKKIPIVFYNSFLYISFFLL